MPVTDTIVVGSGCSSVYALDAAHRWPRLCLGTCWTQDCGLALGETSAIRSVLRALGPDRRCFLVLLY